MRETGLMLLSKHAYISLISKYQCLIPLKPEIFILLLFLEMGVDILIAQVAKAVKEDLTSWYSGKYQ